MRRSDVYFAKYSSTKGQWSASTVIHAGSNQTWNPQNVADNKGNVVAEWIQRNSAGNFVQTAACYTVSSNTWGKPVTVQKQTDANSFATRLGIDGNGAVTMLWLQEGLPLVNGSPPHKLYAARLFCRDPSRVPPLPAALG